MDPPIDGVRLSNGHDWEEALSEVLLFFSTRPPGQRYRTYRPWGCVTANCAGLGDRAFYMHSFFPSGLREERYTAYLHVQFVTAVTVLFLAFLSPPTATQLRSHCRPICSLDFGSTEGSGIAFRRAHRERPRIFNGGGPAEPTGVLHCPIMSQHSSQGSQTSNAGHEDLAFYNIFSGGPGTAFRSAIENGPVLATVAVRMSQLMFSTGR